MIPVSEIFYSIQGEGRYRVPSVFIRVWGCNLRCRFNGVSCDTPYAVLVKEYERYEIDEIIKEIQKYPTKHIVITGGEPLLYQTELIKLLQLLDGYFIEIETNGTIIPKDELLKLVNQFNVSIKLKNSNQEDGFEKFRVNKKAIEKFENCYKTLFKFVVSSEEDIKEIKELVKYSPISLMPVGETKKELLRNIKKVANLCLKYGYEFSNRDHVLIWGNKKGR